MTQVDPDAAVGGGVEVDSVDEHVRVRHPASRPAAAARPSGRRPAGGCVAFFDDHPHMDAGATRWTRMAATELGRRGWSVTVIFPHDGLAAERARAHALEVSVVKTPKVLRRYGQRLRGRELVLALATLPLYWWRLSRVLRRCADVVHVNDHRGLVLSAPAARFAGCRVVWHLHSAHPARTLNRFGSWLASEVLAPSAPVGAACPGLAGAVTCLPNGLESRWFETAPGRHANPLPVVVTVGRLHPIKGVDVLLRAAARLRESGIEFRVAVVGGEQPGHEAYASELLALAGRLGVDTIVDFVGAVDDPAPLLSGATVYVQPSRFEPGGLAVLEAMACGLPVVATTVGGLRDTVVDGRTGWLVAPDDVDALAAALRSVLLDPERSRRFGEAGRTRARAFTLDAVADQLEDVYARVLGAT